jgi:vacuolar-type H+-ATPase subunit E/Vma4
MNEPNLYQVQADALIRQLVRDRDKRCRKLEQETADWCRQHLREARRQALRRFHKAAELERERCNRAIAAAEAALWAEARSRHQQHLSEMVQAVVGKLPEALEKRWQEAAHRQQWIAAALAEAERRLAGGEWTVHIATPHDRESLPLAHGDARLEWHPDSSMRAGLIIDKGGARLDASTTGLLADTSMLESHILTLLGEVRGGGVQDV